MIRDNPERSLISTVVVCLSGKMLQKLHDLLQRINSDENIGIILSCRGYALEPATEIDILLRETLKAGVALNEFHEHIVPDLHESAAIAIGMTFCSVLRIVLSTEIVEHL